MENRDPGSSRRRAREVALQVLYAIDLARGRPSPDSVASAGSTANSESEARCPQSPASAPELAFEAVVAHFEMPEGAREFARELVLEVQGHIEEIDHSISSHATNWRIERMAAVDRNILRLGTYELAHTATPAPVILNEAVDLARRFSNDPSPAFVNGILDAVARLVRESES